MSDSTKSQKDRRGCPKGGGCVEAQPNPKAENLGKIGNPPHEVTEELRAKVRELAATANQETVARLCGFSADTLQRHYLEDYRAGEADAIQDVKRMLLEQARAGSVAAGKAFLGMKGELRYRFEHSGPNGGPIRTIDQAKLAEMVQGKSEEELRALDAALSIILAAAGAAGEPGAGEPAAAGSPGPA